MYPEQNNGIPSIKQPGNWSPLNDFSNDMLPQAPKQSFFGRYKKLLIVAGGAFILLLGLAVVASLSSSKNGTNASIDMQSYSGSVFDMTYAKGLNVISDESDQEGGWALMIGPDKESAASSISIYVTKADQLYKDSEEGLINQQDSGQDVKEIKTTDVKLAGESTQKSSGVVLDDQGNRITVVFSYVKSGDNYIVVSAKYPEGTKIIDDSFDSMLESIKLKY